MGIQNQTRRSVFAALELGLIAQEVEAVLPGAVITNEDGHKLMNYNAVIPLLIDAVQKLQTEVKMLKRSR